MKKKLLVMAGVILALALLFALFKIFTGIRRPSAAARQAVSSLLSQAREAEAKNSLLEARQVYQELINDFPGSSEVAIWQKKLEELNIKLLFSPAITPKSMVYEIKSGDTLSKIASQFKTTIELIKKSNAMKDSTIIPGRKIKIWNEPFSIWVDKSQNMLILKSGEEVFKTYTVSTGKNNCTPVGSFKIVNKLTDPTWFKAGAVVSSGSPENVLGSRWMGFDLAGYGIHGTIEPKELGKQVTQGCVRLSNADVEELYIIVPVGAEVTIVD